MFSFNFILLLQYEKVCVCVCVCLSAQESDKERGKSVPSCVTLYTSKIICKHTEKIQNCSVHQAIPLYRTDNVSFYISQLKCKLNLGKCHIF